MRSMRCIIATVCVLAFAACASAQDDGADPLRNVPKVQIAGGFSSARELEVDQQLPAGWFVSADRNINEWFGLTYDLSASGTVTRHLAYLPGIVTRWSTGALLIGPTFSQRYGSRAVVFVRLLGGIGEAGSSEDGYAAALSIAPGAGVDVYFARRIGVRATADYRSLHGIGTASGAAASQLWLRAGLVVALGTR
jgi:hypothetical protein